MTAQTRSEILALLQAHGLSPRQHLGQHFLADPNITRKIVRIAGVSAGSQVVEVGAGTGTLTRALVEAGAHVVAFEVDRGLEPVLEEATAGLTVELRFEDASASDLDRDLGEGPWVLVSNLPYNIGTRLVLDILRKVQRIELLVVMVQKEVAERLVAGVGAPAYGLPSVIAGIHSRAKLEFEVPPQVFVPPPKVGSAVVSMVRVPAPPLADRAVGIAAAAFNQRRKMVRRSLADRFDDPLGVLRHAGIDPTRRAEELSPADYLRIAAG